MPITDLGPSSAPVVLYGAGNLGRELHDVLAARGVPIRCFLDRAATPGAAVGTTPVLPPDADLGDRRGLTVIVATFSYGGDVPGIKRQLRASGFGRVSSFVEEYDAIADAVGPRFWLAPADQYESGTGHIEQARSLLADDDSRQLYDALVALRLERRIDDLPEPTPDDQYFPATLPRWPERLRLLDGGAYTGDTLRAAVAAGYRIERAACFEPDVGNYARLVATTTALAADIDEAVCLPSALHDETTLLRFSSGLGGASNVADDGDTIVPAVRIDDLLHGFAPNLVKLDVEGGEWSALAGALQTIRTHRPGLAVSAYHRPTDLWELPLLVASWNLGYRLHLRAHGHCGFDTVLYALP